MPDELFFLEEASLLPGEEVELLPDDVHHAFRVLRLRAGDVVRVSDGRGRVCEGFITAINARQARVLLQAAVPAAESKLNLILLQSLTKGEKMDLIVRQAVELGVKRIVPVVTERSVPRRQKEQEARRHRRWQSIVRAAAAQSRRGVLPPVEEVRDFEQALNEAAAGTTLVPWERETQRSLVEFLRQPFSRKGAVLVFIGPEGGFSSREITALQEKGALSLHLGSRILRVETAAAAALALVQGAWGDLGGGGA